MNMYPNLLESIPKIRSELVNDLEIPDVPVTPYLWTPDESPRVSLSSDYVEEISLSSESSLALSRAMTDSEIDYGRYRRLKSRNLSDPWVEMSSILNNFPRDYLESLNSFSLQDTQTDGTESTVGRPLYNEELRLKMERFFAEECRAFSPDDPGLIALEEALRDVEVKDSDTEESVPI